MDLPADPSRLRVLAIVPPTDPEAAEWLNALVSVGWSVDAAITNEPGPLINLDGRVRVHDWRPRGWGDGSPLFAGVAGAAKRLDEAAFRTAGRVGPLLGNVLGTDFDMARHWRSVGHIDSTSRRAGHQPGTVPTPLGDVAAALGVPNWPAHSEMAPALTRLQAAVRPHIVLSHGMLAALYAYASCGLDTAWLVAGIGTELTWRQAGSRSRDAARLLLNAADILVASCATQDAIARESGFNRESVVLPFGVPLVDVAALLVQGASHPPSIRRSIAINGAHDEAQRGLVAIAALRLCAGRLRGYRIELVGAGNVVALSAELASSDCRLDIRAVPLPSSVSELGHRLTRARVSISLAIDHTGDAWIAAAMAAGAFPVTSRTMCATLASEPPRMSVVDPELPRHIAAALSQAVADDQLVDRAADANRRLPEGSADAVAASVLVRNAYNAARRASS